MAQKTAARGRPKGTGVDDAGHLAAIAKALADNPGMKPTTAIKALGITNPSVVRRLRDKYRQQHRSHQPPQTAVAAGSVESAPRPTSNVVALRVHAGSARRGRPSRATPRATGPVQETTPDPSPSGAEDDRPARAPGAPQPDLVAAAFAAGVAAGKTMIHLQYKALWYAFQFSPYACAVRNYEFTRLVVTSLVETADDPRCSRPAE